MPVGVDNNPILPTVSTPYTINITFLANGVVIKFNVMLIFVWVSLQCHEDVSGYR